MISYFSNAALGTQKTASLISCIIASLFWICFISNIPASKAATSTRTTAQACSFGTDWASASGFQVIYYPYVQDDTIDYTNTAYMAYDYTQYGSLSVASDGVVAPTLSWTSTKALTKTSLYAYFDTSTCVTDSSLCLLGSATYTTFPTSTYTTTSYLSTFGLAVYIKAAVLEFSGYFKTDESGIHTFTLSQVDDSAMVWIGEGGFDCCTGAIEQSSDANYIMFATKAYKGNTAAPLQAFLYLTAGYYYPMRIVYANIQSDATLSFTVTLPDGSVISDYTKYVFQMHGGTSCGTATFEIPTITTDSPVVGTSTGTEVYTTYTDGTSIITGGVVVVYTALYSSTSSTAYWPNSYTSTYTTVTTLTDNDGSTYTDYDVVVNLPYPHVTTPGASASTYTVLTTYDEGTTTYTGSVVVVETATIPPTTVVSTGPSATLLTIATTVTDADGNSYSTNFIVTETPYPHVTTPGASASTYTVLTTYDEGTTTYTGSVVVVETATVALSVISKNGDQETTFTTTSIVASDSTTYTTDIIIVETTIPMITTTIVGSVATSYTSMITTVIDAVSVLTSEFVLVVASTPLPTITSAGPEASTYTTTILTNDAYGSSHSAAAVIVENPYPTVLTGGSFASTWTTLTTYSEGSSIYTGTVVVMKTANVADSTTTQTGSYATTFTSIITIGTSNGAAITTDMVVVQVKSTDSQFSSGYHYQNSSFISTVRTPVGVQLSAFSTLPTNTDISSFSTLTLSTSFSSPFTVSLDISIPSTSTITSTTFVTAARDAIPTGGVIVDSSAAPVDGDGGYGEGDTGGAGDDPDVVMELITYYVVASTSTYDRSNSFSATTKPNSTITSTTFVTAARDAIPTGGVIVDSSAAPVDGDGGYEEGDTGGAGDDSDVVMELITHYVVAPTSSSDLNGLSTPVLTPLSVSGTGRGEAAPDFITSSSATKNNPASTMPVRSDSDPDDNLVSNVVTTISNSDSPNVPLLSSNSEPTNTVSIDEAFAISTLSTSFAYNTRSFQGSDSSSSIFSAKEIEGKAMGVEAPVFGYIVAGLVFAYLV